MLRRVSAGAAAWTVGAAASVAVSMLALTVIGGVGGDVQPPAPALDNGLSGTVSSDSALPFPSGSATPSATGSASARPASSTAPVPSGSPAGPSPTPGPPRQFATSAGVLTGQCIGQLAYLVSWSPAPGYQVDDVRRGPAAIARVTFDNPTTRQEGAFGVQCVAGVPRLVHVNA